VNYLKFNNMEAKYTEQDLIDACKYGYDYHKTSQFPEKEFEEEAINNFKQVLAGKEANKLLEAFKSDKNAQKQKEVMLEGVEVYKVIKLPNENGVIITTKARGVITAEQNLDWKHSESNYLYKNHIYILSNDNPNIGDFVYDEYEIGKIHNWDKEHKPQPKGIILVKFDNGEILERELSKCKKVIASTDKNITPNAWIPQSYLEYCRINSMGTLMHHFGMVNLVLKEYFDDNNESIGTNKTLKTNADGSVIINPIRGLKIIKN